MKTRVVPALFSKRWKVQWRGDFLSRWRTALVFKSLPPAIEYNRQLRAANSLKEEWYV